MTIWKVNHFSNAATIQEQFVAWEDNFDLNAYEATIFRSFRVGAPLSNLKYETAYPEETVYTGAIGDGGGTGWDAVATTALPISAVLAGLITNYAVLKVEDEIVVVKSVDTGANTIDVFKRGAGETTAVIHADLVVADILGYNMPRGVKDIDSNYKEQIVDWNFVGKYTVPSLKYNIEQLTENRKYFNNDVEFDNFISYNLIDKDRELLMTTNKMIINGTREEGAEGEPGMTRGILEEASLRGNVVTGVGAISALSVIDDALTASRNKWGRANVMFCWPATFDDIQALAVIENQRPQIINRLQVELGTRVVRLTTKVGDLVVVMDLDFPNDKVVICNSADISIHPFEGFTMPGGDRTTAQDSARNNQALIYDTLTQFGTLYLNSTKNMTLMTGITH